MTKVSPDFVFDPSRSAKETAELRIRAQDVQSGSVTSWSFSSLQVFEKCKWQTYLDRVMKTPKPKQASGAARGTEIHDLAETFVRDGMRATLPDALKVFATKFDDLKKRFQSGQVTLEEEWAFTSSWNACEWSAANAWARVKLDAFVRESETSAKVIDYKTGRRFGNEIKHASQGQQYAIAALMKFPELQFINVEFWYTDLKNDNVMERNYTRERAMLFLPGLERRATAMTTATEFPPSPSQGNCKWCPFRENKTCEWRVE